MFLATLTNRRHADPKIARIAELPVFADCSEADLWEVAAHTDEISVPAGHELISQGQRGVEMMVLVSGSVVVTVDDQPIATVGPGEILGEIAITEQTPRTATVTTAEPTSLLVMHLEDARHLLDGIPSVANAVAEAIARHT